MATAVTQTPATTTKHPPIDSTTIGRRAIDLTRRVGGGELVQLLERLGRRIHAARGEGAVESFLRRERSCMTRACQRHSEAGRWRRGYRPRRFCSRSMKR